MANEDNLVPGAGAGRPDQAVNPPALRSGWRSRRPAPEVLEPHRREIETDTLLIDTLEDALALDKLIVTRVTDWLEERGWSDRGRRLRPEVDRLGAAVDRMAKRAEQLRRARLDRTVAQGVGIVPLTDAFAEIEEGDDEDA